MTAIVFSLGANRILRSDESTTMAAVVRILAIANMATMLLRKLKQTVHPV